MKTSFSLLCLLACLLMGPWRDAEAATRHSWRRSLPTARLDEWDVEEAVETHNTYRRQKTDAANMKYLSWSQELANAAQAHSDKCVFGHGTTTWSGMTYEDIGQNLFFSTAPSVPIGYMIAQWYNEISYWDMDKNECQPGKVCGHYLQVIWAEASQVGCALTRCDSLHIPDNGKDVANALLFTCNYDVCQAPQFGPVYIKGDVCTRCSSGRFWCDMGLCRDCQGLDSDEVECECKAKCENCGKVNGATCTCDCEDGFLGVACEKECQDLSTNCGTAWPSWTCTLADATAIVTPQCPKMCGTCKMPTIDTKTCAAPAPTTTTASTQKTTPTCPVRDCGAHGSFDSDKCECSCNKGWFGATCQTKCPECFDAYPEMCGIWASQQNLCEDAAYANFMSTTCGKSCGTCSIPDQCK